MWPGHWCQSPGIIADSTTPLGFRCFTTCPDTDSTWFEFLLSTTVVPPEFVYYRIHVTSSVFIDMQAQQAIWIECLEIQIVNQNVDAAGFYFIRARVCNPLCRKAEQCT